MEIIFQLFSNGSILFSLLLIAAISGLYSERAGIINIAIDGIMIIGALTYSLIGKILLKYGNWMQIIALLFSIICSGFFSLLHGFASITLKAQQVVSGTALNLLASGIGLFFVSIPSLSSGNVIKIEFNTISIDSYQIINIFLIISIFIAIFTFIFFKFSKTGLRYSGCGENPDAIDAVGINVIKTRYAAVIISGCFSGLSGCIFTHYISGQFRGDVQGQGYIALAIMIFGQWKIQYITLGAALFSFLIALSGILWRFTGWNIAESANQLLKILPFIFALLVMIIFSKYSNIPKASGIPFDKSLR